jgi:hypothetical protein
MVAAGHLVVRIRRSVAAGLVRSCRTEHGDKQSDHPFFSGDSERARRPNSRLARAHSKKVGCQVRRNENNRRLRVKPRGL